MLRPTASAAATAASSVGFLHSTQFRSHNHGCRLVISNNRHLNVMSSKTLLRASSSQSSDSQKQPEPDASEKSRRHVKLTKKIIVFAVETIEIGSF